MPRKPAPAVFISYSHRDEGWKDRLVKHLAVLETQGLLAVWSDRKISAGRDWRPEIEEALASARVAVLLVSPDFLTSPFILGVEVPEILRRRAEEGLLVIPVIVTWCAWDDVAWLSPIQARPRDGKALASFKGAARDKELTAIAKEIRQLVDREPGTPAAARVQVGLDRPEAPSLPPALHQLPSPPDDFVGRESELAELRTAAAAGRQVAIFGLRGMGGVGKTALALKLAAELAPLYPDAQIFLDLQGVTTPLSSAQAMAHVIRSFHPEARVPEDGAELAGLYRSVLHGRRALLLMDNAAGREQVEPLIPPAGCALLVTSRLHFRLPGAATRDLDELPEADARALLRGIANRLEEAEAGQIARLCGRLPFALRLAGSALADRPDLSVADYARSLEEARQRFGEVDASLALSVELLPEDLRGQWYRLAVFPATLDAEAAAAVWALESAPADRALGELVTSSLLEWEAGRYRLHDLARLFARGRLAGNDLPEAQRRHAAYYLKVLRRANSLYKQGGPALLEGLRLFDAEWPSVQAGQAWAAANAATDPEAVRLCSAYPDAGTYCLALRQPPGEQIRWLEAALAAARTREDRSAQALHLGNLGLAYAALGETHRAIEIYEQHLDIARELGNRRGEGSTLNNLGNAYAALGETHRAVELYEQNLDIARELGDRRGESYTLGNLGNAYAALGETHRAIELYEQVLDIARDIGDRRSESNAINNLGNAYAALGETRRAIEFYEQDLAIARDTGDRAGEAITCWNLGLAVEKEGDLERAAGLMQARVDYEREIGHPDAGKDAARVEAIRSRIGGGSAAGKGRRRGGSSRRGGRGGPGSRPAGATPDG